MTILLATLSIVQSIAISLGVGSSTLAITNFFAAIADGTIDATERRMMGIVYVVLRVAMVLILATTVVLISPSILAGGLGSLTTFEVGMFAVTSVLFVNAILMTARLMPSTLGPAIQAGSWYTLGVLVALGAQGITFSLVTFFLAYITWLALAVSIVNGIMHILNRVRAH